MQCPECQHDMVQSKAGWLCPNCGHMVPLSGVAPTPTSTVTATPLISNNLTPQPSAVAETPTPAPSTPAPVTVAAESPSPAPTATATIAPPVVAPSEAVPQPLPVSGTEMGEGFKPPRSKRWLWVVLIVLILGGLGGGGYYAFNQYFRQPQHALAGYFMRLSQAKSGKFAGTVTFSSASQDLSSYKTTINTNGQYQVSDPKNPQIDVKLDGSVGDGKASGEILLKDKILYLRLISLDFLFQKTQVPQDWYKLPLNDQQTLSDKCQDSQNKAWNEVLQKLPLKDTKLVNYFDKVNGHSARHYSGAVDVAALTTVVNDANKQLSADCRIDSLSANDQKLVVTYDLWSGKNFDRIDLKVHDNGSNSDVRATIDTSDYNQPVTITAPGTAKDINTLINDVDAAVSAPPSPNDTSVGAQKARDTQRKSDLRTVQSGLEQFFADKNTYPAGNYSGLSKILVPNYLKALPLDPKTNQPYNYTPAPSGCNAGKKACTSFSLAAPLEYKQDSSYPTYTVTNLQ